MLEYVLGIVTVKVYSVPGQNSLLCSGEIVWAFTTSIVKLQMRNENENQ